MSAQYPDYLLNEVTLRVAVVRAAESWLGTPYHNRARVKGAGVDCAQLLVAAFVEAGASRDLDFGAYSTDWHLHRSEEMYLAHILEHCTEVTTRDDVLPGDIALFRYGRCVSHGGIVIEWPRIIHSYRGLGVVYGDVSPGSDLEPRCAGVYTLRSWQGAVA